MDVKIFHVGIPLPLLPSISPNGMIGREGRGRAVKSSHPSGSIMACEPNFGPTQQLASADGVGGKTKLLTSLE